MYFDLRRSAKNRRKAERKRRSIKEGSVHEDLALVETLHGMYTQAHDSIGQASVYMEGGGSMYTQAHNSTGQASSYMEGGGGHTGAKDQITYTRRYDIDHKEYSKRIYSVIDGKVVVSILSSR